MSKKQARTILDYFGKHVQNDKTLIEKRSKWVSQRGAESEKTISLTKNKKRKTNKKRFSKISLNKGMSLMRVCEFVSFWKLCELRVCEFAARVAKVSNLKFSGEKNVRPSARHPQAVLAAR
jgi:hypothetical protein